MTICWKNTASSSMPDDTLNILAQLRTMKDKGYTAPVSMEPFAAQVHNDTNLETNLRASYALRVPEYRLKL